MHIYAKKWLCLVALVDWWKQTGKPLIFLSMGVISAGMLWVCMLTHAHTSRALLINMAPVGRNRYRLTFSAQLPTLPQSALLITTGTFHTVLDLINDFSSLSSYSPFMLPLLSLPLAHFSAPEPITQSPLGLGLHNHVSSQPSYLSRIA